MAEQEEKPKMHIGSPGVVAIVGGGGGTLIGQIICGLLRYKQINLDDQTLGAITSLCTLIGMYIHSKVTA